MTTPTELTDAEIAYDGDFPDDDEPTQCTGECAGMHGRNWAYTGTQYGGDDESYFGEGRCYCMFCGADGDA